VGKAIVITSGKGGVGKTTTTANLGTALAMIGNKVVVIDADIGLRNLDVVLGLENRIVYDLVDVVEEKCKPKQALIKDKRFSELYLLPAAQTRDKDSVTAEQMEALITDLKKDFDFVLIDCPAGIEQGFRNAIAGADQAIIVTTPEVSAVRDADRIIGLLEASEKEAPVLILNRIKPHMVESGNMLGIDDVLEILAVDLLGIVPDDDTVVVTTNKGEPAVLSNDSLAGQAYRNIAARIVGDEVPLLDIKQSKGLWKKIGSFFASMRRKG